LSAKKHWGNRRPRTEKKKRKNRSRRGAIHRGIREGNRGKKPGGPENKINTKHSKKPKKSPFTERERKNESGKHCVYTEEISDVVKKKVARQCILEQTTQWRLMQRGVSNKKKKKKKKKKKNHHTKQSKTVERVKRTDNVGGGEKRMDRGKVNRDWVKRDLKIKAKKKNTKLGDFLLVIEGNDWSAKNVPEIAGVKKNTVKCCGVPGKPKLPP